MINGKIIKVCGMREAENIQDVEAIEGIDSRLLVVLLSKSRLAFPVTPSFTLEP